MPVLILVWTEMSKSRIIYIHAFIIMPLAIHISFHYLQELWLQSIHSFFAVSEHFYLLFCHLRVFCTFNKSLKNSELTVKEL